MRILVLANNDIGLYQFRKELLTELLNEHEVYISLPYGDLVNPLVDMGCVFIDTPLERRGVNPISDLVLLGRYLSIMLRFKPDMVVTYTIKPNIYGGFVCRIKKIPYVANITGLGSAFEGKSLLRKLVTKMYQIAIKKAITVFFENTGNYRLFVDENVISKEKGYVLNGAGVNLDKFSYEDYPTNDKIKFLFVGRVMKEKGVDELFEAMRKLVARNVSCTLDIVGPFEENYEQDLKACEAEGWLVYHGYQKDVRPFIHAADCFVLPSWHEGMANTNLESAASGRPVITSNIPGCKEAVINNVSGYLCESKSADSLFDVMYKFCMLSKEDRKRMGCAGRQHMEKEFDKQVVVKNTIQRMFGYSGEVK